MTERSEDWSARVLDRWLSLGVAVVILGQLALWVPHYLTWPYWADHDVFASAARAWTEGRLPYRDTRLNNFPGSIYLFWLVGKLAGWGRPEWFYAGDVGLLLGLGGMLVVWSRTRHGRAWPGLIGFLTLLSLILALDYAHAAQRDWHASALVVLALLVMQTWSGWVSLVISAGLTASGFAIRPQVVLLGPALLWSVGWLDPAWSGGRSLRRALIWLAVTAGFVSLLFLPLVVAGVFDDFLGALRLVSPGSAYNQVGPLAILKRWTEQAAELRWWALSGSLVVLLAKKPRSETRLGVAWLLALAGVSLYQPLSPVAHSYLKIPLPVVGSGVLALVLGLLADPKVGPSSLRLVAVLGLAASMGTTLRPDFAEVGPTLRALQSSVRPMSGTYIPPGYRHGSVATSAWYPWADYRATLDFLRDETKPTTRVANLLKGDPALVAMLDRGSALPAESVAWLRMVRPTDEVAFANRLAAERDSVVVWSPNEVGPDPAFHLDQLAPTVRRLYEFEARFGTIEVWRRRPHP